MVINPFFLRYLLNLNFCERADISRKKPPYFFYILSGQTHPKTGQTVVVHYTGEYGFVVLIQRMFYLKSEYG